MHAFVGIDVAKEVHWACAVDGNARPLFSLAVPNGPAAIAALIARIEGLGAERVTVALDMLGGAATLIATMLGEAGVGVVHTPGLAVNRARQGARGGETKSDPKDAAVIAELARTRPDLRPVEPASEVDAELRLLVARRRDLVVDQTRRASRIRELMLALLPALERRIDVTIKTGLLFLSLFADPAAIRAAGAKRIARRVRKASPHLRGVEALAADAVAAAEAQRVTIPGAALRAEMVQELACEALAARDRLAALDRAVEARLARHPDAALIRSLPGMGATLTAEFIAEAGGIERFPTADRLAAAAGLAPILKQSGKVRYLQRASGGNKALKRVFFQSAFCSLGHPTSRAFYARKRSEGKRHHQAVISLARRRVDVLHAMLRNRTPYEVRTARVA
jgi:transposase